MVGFFGDVLGPVVQLSSMVLSSETHRASTVTPQVISYDSYEVDLYINALHSCVVHLSVHLLFILQALIAIWTSVATEYRSRHDVV